MTTENAKSPDDLKALQDSIYEHSVFVDRLISEIGKVIVGQQYMVERLLIGLLTNGHILLEGVPGLAKTKMVDTLSKTLSSNFCRIQFTPDLLPSDITGVSIYNQQTGEFQYKPGPVVSQLVLADEINRATPKTQSALLEAMAVSYTHLTLPTSDLV